MSKYSHEVPDIGTVFITKKRGQRTLRLRVDTKGLVQVSMPWMVPRKHALDFVKSKKDWIKQQQATYEFKPYNGMLFGKKLRLVIEEHSQASRTKHNGSDVIVPFKGDFDAMNATHTAKIQSAIMKALRLEAEAFLLPRLRQIAEMYGFEYKSSAIRQVVGRWGSCDSKCHITLSLFLVQLPIEYIDYVIIHELAHTRHMNHSPAFWSTVNEFCPDYKQLRRKMRGLQPKIYDAKVFMA